ncbi:MAG: DUF4856 domain-containing protein [Pseudomonadota bacterium]
MLKQALKITTCVASLGAFATIASADVYGPYPVTLKGYEGDKTNTVSYSGQIARQVLEKSLKSIAGKGNGGENAAEIEAMLIAYFNNEGDLDIISPKSKDGFPVKQTKVSEISSSANIAGKFYDGAMPAYPGGLSGKAVIMHMFSQAAKSNAGWDPENGYDWGQLISKFTMGAMQYNQAVDNYLDEKMTAGNKPNNAAYKDGAHYTGKEHSWDEGFGYWGAPAHVLKLSADQAYAVSKQKDLASGDANGDGVIDLKSEYTFGPAYYAAAADKSGTKTTNYMPTIMQAFLDGRQIITDAAGEALSADQLAAVQAHAKTIADNWEKVLAEAVFKYAGSVYKDINTMKDLEGEELAKAYRTYGKHWGELAGFSMAIQSGKNNLGATATKMNQLIGFGPVTLDNTYVTGIDADGNFVRERRKTWSDYQLAMLQVQKLMLDTFGVEARINDGLGELADLAGKLGDDASAEND